MRRFVGLGHDPLVAAAAGVTAPLNRGTIMRRLCRVRVRALKRVGLSAGGLVNTDQGACVPCRARTARVIDISYGGIRLELPPAESIPAKFRMAIPGFEGGFRAKPVWSRYTPMGSISCGAELLDAKPRTVAQWRQIVDSIHGAA